MSDITKIEAEIVSTEKKEKGASLVEYALLVALIAVVAIVAIKTVGTNVSGKFSNIGSALG